jgi:dihydroorotase
MYHDPSARPASTNFVEIARPDDWHLHLRDGAQMRAVLPHTVERFARAVVMPNLKPPVITTEMARAYRERIVAAVPEGLDFTPLMTLYLTDHTPPGEIARAKSCGVVAVKYYPAGATTHSEAGVTDLRRLFPVLEALQAAGLPLLVHGEVTDPAVDIFDRETIFIEQQLTPLLRDFPALRVVLEHVTTREGVDFVLQAPDNLAATITAHHLLMNRNSLFAGGIRPHHYCLPVLKHEQDRLALLAAATSGSTRFFLGTDSAPHPCRAKESSCGCAGIYTAHAAIELYAEAFEEAEALDKLEGFASFHGADFYGLPRNSQRLTLTRKSWTVPHAFPLDDDILVPLRCGEQVRWTIVN